MNIKKYNRTFINISSFSIYLIIFQKEKIQTCFNRICIESGPSAISMITWVARWLICLSRASLDSLLKFTCEDIHEP